MDIEWIRNHCLALPRTTESFQWGECVVFKVAGKMFAVLNLDEASPNRLTIKSTPEESAELLERDGIIPAPYLARSHWICFQDVEVVRRAEMKALIGRSYELVVEKLPKKVRAGL